MAIMAALQRAARSATIRYPAGSRFLSNSPQLSFASSIVKKESNADLVQPSYTQLMISNISPVAGSHIRKKRIGRGGRRGGSSGRGNGGQKHHGKIPGPWFTGLYTNPIIEALPRWNFAPRAFKPDYKRLNLDRLQFFIDNGRLDATKPITIRELHRSGILGGNIKDGVKLLGSGSEYFCIPNLSIEVTKASKSAITAIERNGGQIRCVYHTKKGIEQIVMDQDVEYRFEPPIYEKDIEYYSNPLNRGYLADVKAFVRDFQPRGYVYPGEELQVSPTAARIRYSVDSLSDLMRDLKLQQEARSEAFKQAQAECDALEKKRRDSWSQNKWYPSQGDLKWIEIVQPRQ